eukprot:m.145750 g.145750  ORF g.145750 m.145750 type:complete len:978 (-) comp16790_c2_seq7:2263-5196(-)
MLIKEYRIPLPLSVEEYRIAQVYMIDKKSRTESTGGDEEERSGVEILVNEPYTDGPGGSGQFTRKVFHVGRHLPSWFRAILPKTALLVYEEAWNAYPYTRTRYTCPFVEKFSIDVTTMYFDDNGCQENVFQLKGADANREIDYIDILSDQLEGKDYVASEDPALYKSAKSGRGPIADGWRDSSKPIMCAYKICKAEFKYWGLQSKIEKFIHHTALRKTMLVAHRQAWCWQDEWLGLTMADVRRMEAETMARLMKVMGGTPASADTAAAAAIAAANPSDTAGPLVDRRGSTLDLNLVFEDAMDEIPANAEGDEFFDAAETLSISSPLELAQQTSSSTTASASDTPVTASPGHFATTQHVVFVVHGFSVLGQTLDDDQDDFSTFKSCISAFATADSVELRSIKYAPFTLAAMNALANTGIKGDAAIPTSAGVLMSFRTAEFKGAVDAAIKAMNDEAARIAHRESTHIHIVSDSMGALVVLDILTARAADLTFAVDKFFAFGAPLTLRMIDSRFPKAEAPPKIACSQLFNLFHTNDPQAMRVEPLLEAGFAGVPAVKVHNYRQAAEIGNLSQSMIASYRLHSKAMSQPMEQLQATWFGHDRIDYELHGPRGLDSLPSIGLLHLMHASYWENKDAAAFVVQQLTGVSAQLGGDDARVPAFTLALPPAEFLSRRSAVKVRKLAPCHRAADVLIKQGARLTLSARVEYGPLGILGLNQEDVIVYVVRHGEWTELARVQAIKGRITLDVPDAATWQPGWYPVRFVVVGDRSVADCTVYVVSASSEQAVVFGIDGSFADSLSLSGADPKVRAGAVDVVRHWSNQGFLIIYTSRRPDVQKKAVVNWLARHNFPQGITWFWDANGTPEAGKARFLRAAGESGVSVRAAYGAGRDVTLYQDVGVDEQHIFAFAKKKIAGATTLTNGFDGHIQFLRTNTSSSGSHQHHQQHQHHHSSASSTGSSVTTSSGISPAGPAQSMSKLGRSAFD